MSTIQVSTQPPLLFRFGKRLIRANLRGGHRLCNLAAKWGMLDMLVQYRLPRQIVFTVPIASEDYRWDAWDIQHYERPAIRLFCAALEQRSDVTLFDCGADIGTFSASVCTQTTSIGRIFAFEPNSSVLEILRRNMAALPVETCIFPEAVGNVDGIGQLISPDYDSSAHARFIAPGEGGIKITRIDSLQRQDRHVALKIDVEGGELEVLQGAGRTIGAAQSATIVFEAHPDVARRTGRDPLICMQYLAGIRPFQFLVAETGEMLPLDRPLAASGWSSTVNIIASTV